MYNNFYIILVFLNFSKYILYIAYFYQFVPKQILSNHSNLEKINISNEPNQLEYSTLVSRSRKRKSLKLCNNYFDELGT